MPKTEAPPLSGNGKKSDDEGFSTDGSNIGTGPLFRRDAVRKRVRRGTKKKKKSVCFNWLSLITCLITMEAIALVFLVFRSQTILIDPSLEEDTFHLLVWLDTKLGGGGEHDREELEELEAFLVQRTEDRLDHGMLLEHESEKVALDNYYQRDHFAVEGEEKPTVLLVAGSQGSGGRAVVDALVQLNIPMITLDRPTDSKTISEEEKKILHTGQIAWREMISIVTQNGIRSGNYEFKSLPQFSQLRLQRAWEKFHQGFIAKQLPKTNHHHELLYAFQAHDALFMMPVFREFMVGPLKVIQLLRDGRDVALLNSKPKVGKDGKQHPMHSMAERFILETYYEASNTTKSYDDTTNLTAKDQSIVRSMELWNDWNRDSLSWLEERSDHTSDNARHKLDYLQLRTEDLLSPEKKLEALLQLARFTGANETMPFHELCCLSRQAMVMEKSDGYRKSFEKAKAQHNILNKYSAKLAFLHQELDGEEDRRKARLGDLISDHDYKPKRRHPGPNVHGPGDHEKVRDEVHHHRKHRYQDIGDRLAARFPANPAEGRRRLEEEEGAIQDEVGNLLIARAKPLVATDENEGGGTASSGQQGRIKSPEVKAMFKEYYAWRKGLRNIKGDPPAVAQAIEKGEQLLAEYRMHEEHLKGVLTEDSFTRSIEWLKKQQNEQENVNGGGNPPPPPEHISHRYGKWAQVLREQPHLAHRLNAVGYKSLSLFGYEPHMRFMDFDPVNQKAKCTLDTVCNK